MKPLIDSEINRSFIYLLLSLFLSISIWKIQPHFFSQIENILSDNIKRTIASKKTEERIAIIDIDERSLAEIGAWPWSRSTIADLIEIIFLDQNSASLGLDIIFPYPSDVNGDERISSLSKIFPITFAYTLDYNKKFQETNIGKLPIHSGSSKNSEIEDAIPAHGYISNHIGLNNVPCSGNIGYIPDRDGTIRSLPAKSFYQGKIYPAFSEAVLKCSGFDIDQTLKNRSLWKLNFSTELNSLIFISATDLLHHRIPNSFLENKHVLLGSSSLALGDRVSTPLAPLVAGVTVHAAALIDLLDSKQQIKKTKYKKYSNYIPIIYSSFCIILIGFTLLKKSPSLTIATLFFLFIAWVPISLITHLSLRLSHSLSSPFITLSLITATVLPQEWWNLKKIEIRLTNSFSSYVGKAVLNELKKSKHKNSLEPSSKEITVLIVDMQGYTKRIMELSLEESAELTRDFLSRLTAPIINNHGTLDKYTGDGLIAFWGAPLENKDQTDLAISCAEKMIEKINLWNQERSFLSKKPIKIRIGIERGFALVGDLGTNFRSTYTAVGDCINIASRLESLSKSISLQISIGPNAQEKSTRTDLISVGKYQLRDTENSIEVFTILQYLPEN